MNKTKGYIYIRRHPSYDAYDVCKLGKANNIPERDSQYATGEIIRGHFIEVFEVHTNVAAIERLLQYEFRNLNVKYDAGTEFYNKEIIERIEPYLACLGITYRRLSKEEIYNLVRCNRVKKTLKKIDITVLIQILKSKHKKEETTLIPRDYQLHIIQKSILHFQQYNRGLLILMCGVGKTLISLWVAQGIQSNTIIVGVPNKLLLEQWEKEVCKLFPSIPYLIVSGGVSIEHIARFIEYHKKCIVITTYASAHKVYTATREIHFVFDMKILDEAHHLTTYNMCEEHTDKTYIQMLNINSLKQLSLTATMKQLECMCHDGIGNIVSNDNVEYFGEIIDRKPLLWAIQQQIVCDYAIQTIITDQDTLEEQWTLFHIIEETDKRLFLSAFCALKSIHDGHSHHLLVYANNTMNSLKIIEYIKMLLTHKYFEIPELYYSSYHSEINSNIQTNILDHFGKATYGIITCVYCLGEGWDFPLLDGVVFAENMTSNIRIVQSALRAGRKNVLESNKMTKIILPVLNKEDWLENSENMDLKKVREVIYQMGLEDETITQKIKVFRICIEKQKTPPKKRGDNLSVVFGIYDEEFTQQLRLKTVKRTALGITYEKARKIIAENNVKSKEDYYALCERDYRLTTEPETVFKGQFMNWIDYLSIDRIYYDMETCKSKVEEYLLLYPQIKKHYLDLSLVCNELCKTDSRFPPQGMWVEYYNVKDLRDIITITNKRKKAGVML